MTATPLRRRRVREAALIALFLAPVWPLGAPLAGLVLDGWASVWLRYSPFLVLAAWALAVAVLVGEKPRRGRSETSAALHAAGVGAVVVLGLPVGILLVAALGS